MLKQMNKDALSNVTIFNISYLEHRNVEITLWGNLGDEINL